MSARARAAFYCVSDSAFFLGAVAMINSLRLQGHEEPVYVLDCGLTAQQRALLATEVTLVDAPSTQAPHLLKTVAPLAYPSDVMILIDADMVATRSLDPLIEQAAEGRLIAFANNEDRWVAQWGDLLDLGQLERRPYACSGLVLLGGALGFEVLELLDDRQRLVDYGRSFYGTNDLSYPFRFPEQDVLNAIIQARLDEQTAAILAHRLAPMPPFDRIERSGPDSLGWAFDDGTVPYVLHQFLRKPWLERMYHSPYSQLLSRCLLGSDLAIRVPPAWVPRRFRGGLAAGLERAAVNIWDLSRWYLVDLLPGRVAARRHSSAARQAE